LAFSSGREPASESDVVIVAIDEASLKELHHMAMASPLHARLESKQLAKKSSKALAFDVLFLETVQR